MAICSDNRRVQYKDHFHLGFHDTIVNMIFTHLCVTLYFVCIVTPSLSDSRAFIDPDNIQQKHMHWMVFGCLHTSCLYYVSFFKFLYKNSDNLRI